jgi:DNA-binding NarL/FixJ family response regulator
VKPRVLLADDHEIVARGLARLLETEYELAGIAGDGRQLLEAAQELKPDVVVADISMPQLNGIEAARRLKKMYPKLKVVFLTQHSDVAYAARALDAGASGYVLKSAAPSELLTAVRKALLGRTYVTPLIDEEALRTHREHARHREEAEARLTSRQREVLQLVAEGRSAREVGEVLSISPRTVEFHKYRLMEELGVKTTAELTQFAIRHGFLST